MVATTRSRSPGVEYVSPVGGAAPSRIWRVVLIDDSADIRFLLHLKLEASGLFEVVGEAADGVAGTAVTSSSAPDAVVIDMSMPGLGGREVIPDLHRKAPGAAIIVYSAEPPGPSDQLVVSGAVDGVVTKSPDVNELIHGLTEALATR